MVLRKKENYSLMPIEKILSPLSIFNSKIIKLIYWTSHYYFESQGVIIKNILPNISQKKWRELTIPLNTEKEVKSSIAITQKNREYYENLSKKNFEKLLKNCLKKEKQCLILYPEIAKLDYALQNLNSDLKEKSVTFHSDIKKDQAWKNWKQILNRKALIVFATRQGVFLPFQNLNLIIIQDESSLAHKSWDQHPKYNAKHVALKLSELHNAKIVFNDPTPSFESYLNIKQKKYRLKGFRIQKNKKLHIIDMGQMINSKMNFSYISPRLKNEIEKIIKSKGEILLFQNRRGLATYIFCKDCGYYYSCPNCSFSLVYDKVSDKLVCHWCGHKETPPKACRRCQSKNIKYSGHGTQKVLEEISTLFPKTKIAIFDYDNVPTTNDRLKMRNDFIESKEAGIMIATSIILSIPKINFNLSAVLNYDLLVNFPDYQTNERILRLIRRLEDTTERLYLQSYNIEDSLLLNLVRGEISNIYRRELMLRQDLYYPPYWHFVTLKFSHKNEVVVKKEAKKLYHLIITVWAFKDFHTIRLFKESFA